MTRHERVSERVSGGRGAGSEWVGECGQEKMNAYMNE